MSRYRMSSPDTVFDSGEGIFFTIMRPSPQLDRFQQWLAAGNSVDPVVTTPPNPDDYITSKQLSRKLRKIVAILKQRFPALDLDDVFDEL